MAWDGTQTITRDGRTLKIVATGFNADTEKATVIALRDHYVGAENMPNRFAIQAERTAGDTDVVSISLQGSIDGTNFTDVAEAVATTGVPLVTATLQIANAPYSHVRIYATTVGAGNTDKVTCFLEN